MVVIHQPFAAAVKILRIASQFLCGGRMEIDIPVPGFLMHALGQS